jgi:hypothetical protein
MRSGLLRWLFLLPLLAALPAGSGRARVEPRAPEPAIASSYLPDASNAVRPAAAIAMQVVAREKAQQGFGGAGSIRPTLPARGIEARAAHRARLDLATWRASHAVTARGGVLEHFATAPPLHG